MKPPSTRDRLALWYTAVFSLGSILLAITIWAALHHMLYQELAETLHHQMSGLEQYIRGEAAENYATLPHEIAEYAQSLPAIHILSVRDDQGRTIYQSGISTDALPLPGGEQQHFEIHGQHFLVSASSLALAGRGVQIVLGLRTDEIEHTSRLLGGIVLAVVPIFIVCGILGGRWLSRRALKPVLEITQKARAIGLSNLSERLPVPPADDEIQLLTQTWNDMLSRLESAFSRVTEFTANASHELRTPLAVIRLAAENALRKSRTEAEYRGALDKIKAQSADMTALIEELLFLARADSHTPNAAAGVNSIDLLSLSSEALESCEPIAQQKSIHLKIESPSEVSAIAGNALALRQLILILLDNALKYTPARGTVSLHLAVTDQGVELSVRDTGIGISEADLPLIFERFYRADPSRNRDSGGHGLGLAIAQSIALAHRTKINVTSNFEAGSVFSVVFPPAPSWMSAEPSTSSYDSGASAEKIPLVN